MLNGGPITSDKRRTVMAVFRGVGVRPVRSAYRNRSERPNDDLARRSGPQLTEGSELTWRRAG